MKTGSRFLPCIAFAGVMSLVVTNSDAFAATEAKFSKAVLDQIEAFHGHVCAGSIFGARIGLVAKEALKKAGGTGKFTARYYDLSCPLDGVQVGAGTTYGNAAITVEDRDEHRLVLTAEGNNRKVEARLTHKAEELALETRTLVTQAKSLPVGSSERLRLELKVQEIHSWLITAPDEEIVVVTTLAEGKGKR